MYIESDPWVQTEASDAGISVSFEVPISQDQPAVLIKIVLDCQIAILWLISCS